MDGVLNGLNLLQSNTKLDLSYFIANYVLVAGMVHMSNGSQDAEASESMRKMAIASFEVCLENANDFFHPIF